MNEEKDMVPANRVCPLLIAAGFDHMKRARKCLGPKCALWIALQKPMTFGDGKNTYSHPDYKLHYCGCGLVANIPWKPIKREQQKQGPSA